MLVAGIPQRGPLIRRFPPFFIAQAKNGTLFSIVVENKTDFMKQVLNRLLVASDDTHDKFKMSTTLFMILLFLTFWGVSFYVLVNSLA